MRWFMVFFARFPIGRAIAVSLALLVAETSAASEPERPALPGDPVIPFLTRYCLDCHSQAVSEGDHEFESFRFPLETAALLAAADSMLLQIGLGQMPPPDADQPTEDERRAVTSELQQRIAYVRGQFGTASNRTALRRLSNREYENTLATLFDRRVDTLGLTAGLPRESVAGPFDTTGDVLVTSGFLLDRYFDAADRLVELRLGRRKAEGPHSDNTGMEPQTWHFSKNFKQYEELTGAHERVFNFEYLCLYEQPNTDTRQGGYGHIEDFLDGVPVSGLYDIEVHAQAFHRDTHYDPKIFRIDFTEPFQLGVVPGDATKGHIHYPQAVEPVLATAVVPDDEPAWLRFQVWLEAGQTPRFIFPNGPYESRASVIEINTRYKDEFDPKTFRSGVVRTHLLMEGELPHIRIGEIKIHGPLVEPGGGREERAVFAPNGFDPTRAVEQLQGFASRAFRRPLRKEEAERIGAFFAARRNEQASPRQAALETVKFILCSPAFLYLGDTSGDRNDRLGPYALASRLSYAVWGRPPDEQLHEAAAVGDLTTLPGLQREIGRLLEDDRSEECAAAFLDGWLKLRNIGSLPPARQDAREYYAEDLPASMKQEARLFFQHLLETDGPVEAFLDCNFTFVDKKLARLYKLPEGDSLRLADGFQKISLAEKSHRGGLLGMAAVLTASANGVETSPVTRGVWVSESILGISPPPPPPTVPAIDANVAGSATIREKLARHSQDTSCNTCHRKIDPLGFGLERFDPIGRYRSQYPKNQGGVKIDASGCFPSGERYADFAEFKQALVHRYRERFFRTLVEQFLTYATGRRMERADQFEIDAIVERMQQQGAGLRSLVVAALTSEVFRRP